MINKAVWTGKDNYFVSADGNSYSSNYVEGWNFRYKMNDNEFLDVKAEMITKQGEEIYFTYNDTMYHIHSDNENYLVRAGYIVCNNFDSSHMSDTQGMLFRSNITGICREALNRLFYEILENDPAAEFDWERINSTYNYLKFTKGRYRYTIRVNQLFQIVKKNLARKTLSLAFYPFIKNMDNFGTLYLSIFAEKLVDETDETCEKYVESDSIVERYIELINKVSKENKENKLFKYVKLIVKGRILYNEKGI